MFDNEVSFVDIFYNNTKHMEALTNPFNWAILRVLKLKRIIFTMFQIGRSYIIVMEIHEMQVFEGPIV